jgi:hypothetical protein
MPLALWRAMAITTRSILLHIVIVRLSIDFVASISNDGGQFYELMRSSR